ncbi:MAG TPA: NAD(P)H-dependent oxidoreductase subunit E [Syntrophales bacterium]|mgnify:CR=1 FL=1|nr:NAD(P)H-dependent oxidoreductase subunit E [Syntrophales bacterium]
MRQELVNRFSGETMVRVDGIIAEYGKTPGALLVVLEKVQDETLYLPVELQRYIAGKMGIPPSRVFGVATFYSYFSIVPRGRKVVKVCSGTACYVKRAGEIMDRLRRKIGVEGGEVSPDGEYSIEEVRCLGACGLAPVVVIGDQTFGLIDPENVEEIIEKAGEGS